MFVQIYQLFAYVAHYALRSQVQRLCNKLGVRVASTAKQSKHLDYDHPAMEAVRCFVRNCHETHSVNKRLVAHFDQVWTIHFEHHSKVIFKRPDQVGTLPDLLLPSEKKVISSLLSVLHVEESAEADGCGQPVRPSHSVDAVKSRLNAAGHQVPVDQARQARTTTTLSWADGKAGFVARFSSHVSPVFHVQNAFLLLRHKPPDGPCIRYNEERVH